MNKTIIISILIGIGIGATLFPMIIIPVMGIGLLLWAVYLLVHDIIMPFIHQHNQGNTH